MTIQQIQIICNRCKQPKLPSAYQPSRLRADYAQFQICRDCRRTARRSKRRLERDRQRQVAFQDRMARELQKAERGPLGHLAGPPKHPLLRNIKMSQRLGQPLFFFLPDGMREAAIRRYDQRMPELELKYGGKVPQIVEAGLIGGITKSILYPDQRMNGQHSRLSHRMKRVHFNRYLDEFKLTKARAMAQEEKYAAA